MKTNSAKLTSVVFADQTVSLGSFVEVKCTVCGESTYWTRNNVMRLIKDSYDNNYTQFIKNYVSRKGRAVLKEKATGPVQPKVRKNAKVKTPKVCKDTPADDEIVKAPKEYSPKEYDPRPEGYRKYLIQQFISATRVNNQDRLYHTKECFLKRWERNIEQEPELKMHLHAV